MKWFSNLLCIYWYQSIDHKKMQMSTSNCNKATSNPYDFVQCGHLYSGMVMVHWPLFIHIHLHWSTNGRKRIWEREREHWPKWTNTHKQMRHTRVINSNISTFCDGIVTKSCPPNTYTHTHGKFVCARQSLSVSNLCVLGGGALPWISRDISWIVIYWL